MIDQIWLICKQVVGMQLEGFQVSVKTASFDCPALWWIPDTLRDWVEEMEKGTLRMNLPTDFCLSVVIGKF
jgi:hypothetical protein